MRGRGNAGLGGSGRHATAGQTPRGPGLAGCEKVTGAGYSRPESSGGGDGTKPLPPRPNGSGKIKSVATWAERRTGPRAPRLRPVPGVWSVSGRLAMGFSGLVLKL